MRITNVAMAFTIALVSAAGGASAQAPDIGAGGADGETAVAPVLGVDSVEFWGGEREMIHVRSYGDGMMAVFQSVDTTTCDLGIETTVRVQASRGVLYLNDKPYGDSTIESNVVSIVAGAFDRCLASPLWSVTATGPASQLQLNASLKAANLRSVVPGTDDFGQPVTVTVDLVWNGAGQRDKSSDHDANNAGVYRFVSNATGTIREAVAGGTVAVGALDVTPLPSILGGIEKDSTRRLVVYR